MYSAYDEGKSVVAERFIRTLKSKNNKYMTSVAWYSAVDVREEVVGTFYGNELQKTNQEEFRTENFIKRNGDKLDAK